MALKEAFAGRSRRMIKKALSDPLKKIAALILSIDCKLIALVLAVPFPTTKTCTKDCTVGIFSSLAVLGPCVQRSGRRGAFGRPDSQCTKFTAWGKLGPKPCVETFL